MATARCVQHAYRIKKKYKELENKINAKFFRFGWMINEGFPEY